MLLSQDLLPLQKALFAKGVPFPTGPVQAVLEYEDRSVFNEDAGQLADPDTISAIAFRATMRLPVLSKSVLAGGGELGNKD
jgi:hypothetical protein